MEWPPPWIELPRDVTENILRRVGPLLILEFAQKVCTTWRSLCSEPSFWRVMDIIEESYDFDEYYDDIFYNSDVMYRRAVDLSQGELIDINIHISVTDRLLRYISERSSRLKRLRLGDCNCISIENLTASIKKLPELEELHLFFLQYITAEEVEAIIISCPKLKSLTFNFRSYIDELLEVDNSCALTIAKNMPNLQHLCLIGNRLNNEGLKAILNGCPKLESLDLCKCFCVDLQGDFGKICSERIKYLKCHSDSVTVIESDDMIIEEDMYI
ncbi:hypothetical protein CASFOL_014529 [Castilleja foliolosa]|uniref:F-box domain-containing protein n=1 Tax=Castilleja foliolosa TaxID=1961234 RepID=A0ABD3BIK2_9LAMI